MTNQTSRKLIHMAQYSPASHITFQDEVSFWRKDGYEVEIRYGDVWLLIVWERISDETESYLDEIPY